LDIWNLGLELVKQIYKLTEDFTRQELYGLASQMRCSAISIPSNIAEGFRQQHNKEYKQFLSLGSCAELETQITIAKELNYIPNEKESALLEKLDYLSRTTSNLLKSIMQSTKQNTHDALRITQD